MSLVAVTKVMSALRWSNIEAKGPFCLLVDVEWINRLERLSLLSYLGMGSNGCSGSSSHGQVLVNARSEISSCACFVYSRGWRRGELSQHKLRVKLKQPLARAREYEKFGVKSPLLSLVSSCFGGFEDAFAGSNFRAYNL